MKRIMRFWMVLALLATAACEHKELCYEHPHVGFVRVLFDWSQLPGANPECMYVRFFPEEGGRPVQYEFTGRDGGTVQLSPGNYRIICHNGDMESTHARNTEQYDTFEFYTPQESLLAPLNRSSSNVPRADGTETQQVVRTPEYLYGDCCGELTLRRNETTTVTLTPTERVCTYTVEIRNVENMDKVVQISGTLSGMAGAYCLVADALRDAPCILPFEFRKADATTVEAHFHTFGHCPEPAVPHKIVVYGIMTRGAQQYQVYGDAEDVVTPQIHGAADPHRVHIVLDGLRFTDDAPGGGMNPSVDDWGSVEIEIPM